MISTARTRTCLIASVMVWIAVGCSNSPDGGMTGSAGTLDVDPTGGGDFDTIQGALDAASPGALIRVGVGTFEGKLVVSKSVRIVGSGVGTVLRASGTPQSFPDESGDDSSAVLEIRNASGVVVENLSFSGPEDGIAVRNSTGITIRNVDASGNGDDGIDIRGSQDVTVSGTFDNNGDKGVQVRDGSSEVTVDSARMTGNGGKGIRLRDSTDCSLTRSTSSSNLDDGIVVRDSSGITIEQNTSSNNMGYGIRVRNSPTTVLQANTTQGNRDGNFRED